MAYDAVGMVYISIDEWSEFVLKQLPKTSAEVALGSPKLEDGCIAVPYALSTECNPRGWANPPDFLQEEKA